MCKETKIKISNANMFDFLVDNHAFIGKKASRASPVGTLEGQKDVTAKREMAVLMESIANRSLLQPTRRARSVDVPQTSDRN